MFVVWKVGAIFSWETVKLTVKVKNLFYQERQKQGEFQIELKLQMMITDELLEKTAGRHYINESVGNG